MPRNSPLWTSNEMPRRASSPAVLGLSDGGPHAPQRVDPVLGDPEDLRHVPDLERNRRPGEIPRATITATGLGLCFGRDRYRLSIHREAHRSSPSSAGRTSSPNRRSSRPPPLGTWRRGRQSARPPDRDRRRPRRCWAGLRRDSPRSRSDRQRNGVEGVGHGQHPGGGHLDRHQAGMWCEHQRQPDVVGSQHGTVVRLVAPGEDLELGPAGEGDPSAARYRSDSENTPTRPRRCPP